MVMTAPFSGGCLCGAIRYRVDQDSRFEYVCHCTDCQKVNGTAWHAGVIVEEAAFHLTGKPREYAVTADSGRRALRYFCGTCGGQLYSKTETIPGVLSVKAGTLDDPSTVQLEREIWCRSELPWARLPDGLPRHQRGPRDD